MSAYRTRPRLRIWKEPRREGSWPSAGSVLFFALSAVAFLLACAWMARTMDADARKRDHERDMRELDERERVLKAQIRRLGK